MKINFKKLRELRIQNRFTQKVVAGKCGFPRTTYINWERGIRRPDYLDVLKICKVLNIDPTEICLEEIPSGLSVAGLPPGVQDFLQIYNNLNSEAKRNLAKEMIQKLVNDLDALKKLGI